MTAKTVEELVAIKTRIILKAGEWLLNQHSLVLIVISILFYGLHGIVDFLAHSSHYVLPVIGPVSVFVMDHVVLRGYDDSLVATALFCDVIVMARLVLRTYYWLRPQAATSAHERITQMILGACTVFLRKLKATVQLQPQL